MFGNCRGAVIADLLAVSLCLTDVLAASCGPTWIKSQADADELRENCKTVTGHVGIGPFNGTSTVHINLDGIQLIEGTLGEYPYSPDQYQTQPYYTLTSSSLREVDAVEFGSYDSRIVNLTLPALKHVNDYFAAGRFAHNLTYLDLTSLETASDIRLFAPDLTTLHHTRLQNVTKLQIHSMKVESLDSLTDNPLNLREATLEGPFPNIRNISIGFTTVKYLTIEDDSYVTLGSSSVTDMGIERLQLSGGVTSLERSAHLDTLTVDTLKLTSSISITHLEVPFDNLRSLQIEQRDETHPMRSITLPPKAQDWTGGFQLHISNAPDLNLTSVYGVDDQGGRIQTWYWPKNVTDIFMADVTVGNDFFEPFVAQQKAPLDSQSPPSVLENFSVVPSANSTSFNCTPFTELVGMGRLPSGKSMMYCQNSTQPTSGAILAHTSIPLSVLSTVLATLIWML